MKKKRIICSALAAAMLLSAAVPAAGAARFPDSIGHWSESAIDRWSDYGVIVGANGQFSPDAPITRGEMASIIAGMLGLEETASNRFSDLNGGWYTDAMLKCYAAGILVGDDLGLMRPYDNITGQEVAVILCKALGLSATPYASTGSMVIGEIDPWAQGYISALASRGAVTGNDGGYFVPMTNTSRAAVVSMFDRAIGTYISSPGTYTATGLTIVNTSGTVTLKGTAGDVIVTAKSDKLKLKLDDTRVTGKIELRADEVQLTAEDADISGDIIVMGEKSTVALNGKTDAGTVRLEPNAGSSKVTVAKNAEANLIRTAAAKSDITVSGDVDDIELLSGAASSDVAVKSGGKVAALDSAANKVTISGDGTLKKATISGDNNKIDTDDTKVTVAKGVSGTKVNGSSQKSGSSSSSSKTKEYDVIFYMNDGSKDKHTTKSVDSGKKVSEPKEPTRKGYVFIGWYTDDEKETSKYEYDFSDKVKSDIKLYAHWAKAYTVTFDYNDGVTKSISENVKRDTKISEPKTPTHTGYTFDGWFTEKVGGTKHNFSNKITKDTTLYAHWTINKYTVKFITDGGTAIDEKTVEYGKTITGVTTTKNGYDFEGWYTDENKTQKFDISKDTVTDNLTLYAKWTPATKTYTVTFNSNGGSSIASQEIKENEKASKPVDPIREGYTFISWYEGDTETAYDFGKSVTTDITLTAKWQENDKVTITLDLNYEGSMPIVKNPYKSSDPVALDTPSRDGYKFDGWFDAPTGGNSVTALTAEADKALYAHWTQQFTVTLNPNEGTLPLEVTSSLTVDANSPLNITPTRTGYKFLGWFNGETEVKIITENVSVTAKWELDDPQQQTSSEITQP